MHSPKSFLKEVKKEAGGDDEKGGNI
jgi:hypothetical protein